MTLRLNLGCGARHLDGYVNVDVNAALEPDIVFDADDPTTPWPFEDNTFGQIRAIHSLEHFRNYLWVIEEMYRVSAPGAVWLIEVPYVTNTRYNQVNPFHHTHFNEHSFKFFDPNQLKGSANEETRAHLVTKDVHLVYFPEYQGADSAERDFAREHYWNVVKEISFALEVVK